MAEFKTFGELSLKDKIYWVSENEYGFYYLKSIKEADDSDFVSVKVDGGEDFFELPCDDHLHEIENLRLTTDKDAYKEWKKPFLEREIKKKEKRIAELQEEIEELKKEL